MVADATQPRAILGAAMTVIAFVIERRVLRAIRQGSVKPVPDVEEAAPSLAAASEQVGDEP